MGNEAMNAALRFVTVWGKGAIFITQDTDDVRQHKVGMVVISVVTTKWGELGGGCGCRHKSHLMISGVTVTSLCSDRIRRQKTTADAVFAINHRTLTESINNGMRTSNGSRKMCVHSFAYNLYAV